MARPGRDERGRFAQGAENKGRPKGSISHEKQQFAQVCREALSVAMGPHARALFAPLLDFDSRALAVRQRFIEFLADRGFGAVPKDIEEGEKAKTLENMLESIREARNMESDEAQAAGTAVGRPVDQDEDEE